MPRYVPLAVKMEQLEGAVQVGPVNACATGAIIKAPNNKHPSQMSLALLIFNFQFSIFIEFSKYNFQTLIRMT